MTAKLEGIFVYGHIKGKSPLARAKSVKVNKNAVAAAGQLCAGQSPPVSDRIHCIIPLLAER